jgi:hypothetical protein|tara:strand:+ start:246 stop:569 length:324 start_codon:yes stop_codon:yes gene_type:complete
MRYPKYLINAFAILGVASFIFLACSAGETAMNEDPIENNGNNDGNNNPPIQNNNGKYQVSLGGPGGDIVILNTETGVLKTYYVDATAEWVEGINTNNPGTGNLTVTH